VPVCVQSRVDWQELVGNSKLLQDQLTLHRKSRWNRNTTAAGSLVRWCAIVVCVESFFFQKPETELKNVCVAKANGGRQAARASCMAMLTSSL
jgi:hypothetical protein